MCRSDNSPTIECAAGVEVRLEAFSSHRRSCYVNPEIKSRRLLGRSLPLQIIRKTKRSDMILIVDHRQYKVRIRHKAVDASYSCDML
jgi:hypothetical protein